MRRFEGRTAVVTGASRGIGAAIAERLAAEGASVVVTARTMEPTDKLPGSLAETLERCRRHGATAEAVVADLGDDESRATIVPAALEILGGRIDVLVNNAAAAIYQPLFEYPLRRRRLMYEINVHAPVDLMQAAVPGMLERGEGWVVNLSSATARLVPGPPFALGSVTNVIGVYGSTKAALNRLTNAAGVDLHGRGVRVNTVEPRAAVMSEGAEVLVGDSVRDDQIESMEAMVEAAVHLCQCEPDRTGQVFVSLDLLDELGLTVMELDASGPYPGGQQVHRP